MLCACGAEFDWDSLPEKGRQDVPPDESAADCAALGYVLVYKNCPSCGSTRAQQLPTQWTPLAECLFHAFGEALHEISDQLVANGNDSSKWETVQRAFTTLNRANNATEAFIRETLPKIEELKRREKHHE